VLENLLAADIKGIAKLFKDHKDILSKVKCTEEDLRKKKQYLQVAKLDKSQYSFDEMKALIGEDDVESWVLEAVSEGIIQAKIDQSNNQVLFRSQTLGFAENEHWKGIEGRLGEMRGKLEAMRAVLQ